MRCGSSRRKKTLRSQKGKIRLDVFPEMAWKHIADGKKGGDRSRLNQRWGERVRLIMVPPDKGNQDQIKKRKEGDYQAVQKKEGRHTLPEQKA